MIRSICRVRTKAVMKESPLTKLSTSLIVEVNLHGHLNSPLLVDWSQHGHS